MNLFSGIAYNFKGLGLGLKTPSLLLLGLARLAVILILTLLAVGLIMVKYQEIASLVWAKPESAWLVWAWYLLSWIIALLLGGICAVAAFLIAQLLFSVVLMDYMSRITERRLSGTEVAPPAMAWHLYFVHLIRQEIPRATLPVSLSLAMMVFGWLTPLAPLVTVVSPLLVALFLAWDNTDLVPARRLEPFRKRMRFLRQNLSFHLGFGLCFLIPGLNVLLLSFAPVGATMFHIEGPSKPDPAKPDPAKSGPAAG